jgi:hypothetical protein
MIGVETVVDTCSWLLSIENRTEKAEGNFPSGEIVTGLHGFCGMQKITYFLGIPL